MLAFTRQHLEISIHFYKRLFRHRGLFSTIRSRKHAVVYDRFHESYGEGLVEYLDRLESGGEAPSGPHSC